MIGAVVFDIGNVLVGWDPEGLYDRLIGSARRRALFAAVDLHRMNEGVDLGAPFRPSVEALARAHPEWRAEVMLWHARWLDMFAPAIPRSARLLRALRARGVPVLALSNFGRETFALAQDAYPVLREFDGLWVSGHLGVMKPDAAIYARLETDVALPGEALLFADDRPENVDAARARGWRAHLFDGPDGWAARLVAEGLLSRAEAA